MNIRALKEGMKFDSWFPSCKASSDSLGKGEPMTNNKSNAAVWKTTETVVNAINGNGELVQIKTEDHDMKWTKRTFLFINILALLICSGLLINRSSVCIGSITSWMANSSMVVSNSRFFAKDTAITIKEHVKHKLSPSDEIPFIDLIICPNFFSAYKKDALNFYGLSRGKYRGKGKWNPTKNENGTNLRKVFDDVTHDVEEIFSAIRIKTLSKQRRYVDVYFTKDVFNEYLSITTKYSDSFGRCFSIIPKQDVLKLGVKSMIFETRMDIYVYFGHPGQFLAADSDTKVHSDVGGKVFLDFDYELSINTLEDSELMACDRNMNLNFDNRVYEMASASLEREYKCTIPFLPAVSSNITGKPIDICKNEEIAERAMELYEFIETSQRNNTPCARMDILLGLPFISKGSVPYQGFGHNDTAFILLYFKSSIKVKSTVWDYDFITLVAEIGGYTGLLVGFPIARGVILINSIILKILTTYRKTGKLFNVRM